MSEKLCAMCIIGGDTEITPEKWVAEASAQFPWRIYFPLENAQFGRCKKVGRCRANGFCTGNVKFSRVKGFLPAVVNIAMLTIPEPKTSDNTTLRVISS